MPGFGSNRLGRVAPGTAYVSGNVFASNLTPVGDGTCRVTVAISAAQVMRLVVNSQGLDFNESTALNADDLYSFEFGVNESDAINFSFGGAATIRYFVVQQYRDR